MANKAIQTVGIAGLGLLGRGIAASLLANGLRVIGFTRPASGFAEARSSIQDALDDLVQHGAADAELSREWTSRYSETSVPAELAGCDYVIESVFEDLAVKRGLFDELEAVLPPHVPIASNTSALPISVLQAGRLHPQRFVGMHWADPCHLTRFLEVIRGEQTDEATILATLALARRAGKEPTLVKKDIEGFIINRLCYAMYREAFHLLESGVGSAEEIDLAFRNAVGLFAAVVGPFRWMDLTGLPAYAKVMARLFPKLDTSTRVPPTMQRLVDSGAQGVSNGRGFYTYTPAERENWERRLRENVWRVRAAHDMEFPLQLEKSSNS